MDFICKTPKNIKVVNNFFDKSSNINDLSFNKDFFKKHKIELFLVIICKL